MCARNGTQICRTIRSRSCGKFGPGTALVPKAMTQPDPAFVIAHFEARDVSMILAALDTSAITQLMFDLCSAPYKALRFAPPARTRGLRALTVPARRWSAGNYVMAFACSFCREQMTHDRSIG